MNAKEQNYHLTNLYMAKGMIEKLIADAGKERPRGYSQFDHQALLDDMQKIRDLLANSTSILNDYLKPK